MSALKIRKVGNSLGVIFPKELHQILNVSEGDFIDATLSGEGKIILNPRLSHHSKWKFSSIKSKSELSTEDLEWLNADLEDEDDFT